MTKSDDKLRVGKAATAQAFRPIPARQRIAHALEMAEPRPSERPRNDSSIAFFAFVEDIKRQLKSDRPAARRRLAAAALSVTKSHRPLPTTSSRAVNPTNVGILKIVDGALTLTWWRQDPILVNWAVVAGEMSENGSITETDIDKFDSSYAISVRYGSIIWIIKAKGKSPGEVEDISADPINTVPVPDADIEAPVDRRRRSTPLAAPSKPRWAEENRLTEPLRIRFAKGMLDAIDQEAEDKNLTRTDVVRAAVAAYLKIDPT